MITTTVREIGNIDETLRQLEAKLGRQVMRQALRKAGNVVRGDARNRAPRRSGLMSRKIITRVGYSRRERAWGAQVGVFGAAKLKGGKKAPEHPYYAPWVERGHNIVPRRRSKKDGFARVVMARNADGSLRVTRQRISRKQAREDAATAGRRVAPRPFLEPALVARHAEVHRMLMEELKRGLDDALGRPL